ncbi:MAG: DUF2336 domain-containing protein [Alphaproteobacteria bacterium]
MSRLSRSDLVDLSTSPTPERRLDIATHIIGAVKGGGLSDEDRESANEILRLMTRDAAVRVREGLAEIVGSMPDIPKDVVLRLAEDFDRVAAPILRHSPLLSEEELIELVRSGSESKQTSIAQRDHVPDALARVIVEEAGEAPVSALVANPGAELAGATMDKAIDRFGASERVTEALARRTDLPVTIAERLVTIVSDNLRTYLASRPDFSRSLAHVLAEHSRGHATISLFDDYGRGRNIAVMVEQLSRSKRLTASLILRAACIGDIDFLEAALAKRAGLSVIQAWRSLHMRGQEGVEGLIAAAGLPKLVVPILTVALAAHRDLTRDGGELDRRIFRARMIERVLTDCQDMATGDIDYLLLKVDQLSRQAEAA